MEAMGGIYMHFTGTIHLYHGLEMQKVTVIN